MLTSTYVQHQRSLDNVRESAEDLVGLGKTVSVDQQHCSHHGKKPLDCGSRLE